MHKAEDFTAVPHDVSPSTKSSLESLFSAAQFSRSAHHLSDLPPDENLEVAFAGRSNAGKSTALNTIVGRNRLAFTSKTPGRTQLINFFSVGEGRFLVDLPGYGYAGVPLEIKAHWGELLSIYVGQRVSLQGLVVIMDIRHPLTKLDRQLMEWFAPTGKPLHVLLAKADKLTRAKALEALREVEQVLHADFSGYTAQLFSGSNRQGLDEARERVATLLDLQPKIKTPG
jgi:GTP-binding protein